MAVHSLGELLRYAQPKLQAGNYVFVTLPEWPELPPMDVLMSFREREGITFILEQSIADKHDLVYEYVAAWITMEVNSALDAVGFTAAFAQALTEHSIGCNVVAAFHHDHLFVGRADGKRAVEILQKLTG
ncbi:MAG: hypothetical protein ACJA0J_002387 [Bdellovibrionota bacterium]|jgi:hypothetical protein